jgi:hypothetical protein
MSMSKPLFAAALALIVASESMDTARAMPLPSTVRLLSEAVPSTPVLVSGRHHGGDAGAAIAAGILGDLILGGIAASQYGGTYYPYYYPTPGYYYGPPPGYYGPGYTPDWMAYCAGRYRSFDPASGTYLGYDGMRHYCR